jgi:hypothetical protein
MRHAVAALLITIVLPAGAQVRDVSRYERWLVPVLVFGASGANGSEWETRLWLRNDGATPLDVFPLSPAFCLSSFCRLTIRSLPALEPRSTAVDNVPGQGLQPSSMGRKANGGFLYVDRERADQLSAELHLRDRGRTPNDWTRIPLVPERLFFASTRSIAAVPIDTLGRICLRIYSLDPDLVSDVAVRIYDAAPDGPGGAVAPRLLVERQLRLQAQVSDCGFSLGYCPAGVPYQPGYAAITDLVAAFPEITAAHKYGLRIEIEPLTPGLRYWPMVTVANNETNHTTVYTVR